MNALDNLLLIAFVAVFLFFCYKKKKFIFSKLRKGEETVNKTTPNITGTSNVIPMPVMGTFPQMYPYGMPTATPTHLTQCKIIGIDSTVIDSDADLEHIINTELSKLTTTGFTVQNVDTFAFRTADDTNTMHIAFCITYGR